MSQHRKYGGSTATRTLNCPAWHHLSEGIPRQPAGPAAILGTALHAVVEACTRNVDLDPFDFVGKTIETVKITEAHIVDKVYPALDEYEKLMNKYDIDSVYVEQWLEVSDDVAGTADLIGVSTDRKTIVFADYKSGDGHMVEAAGNHQGLFYAMCAAADKFNRTISNAEKIVIAIVQPSHRREDYLDVWETTPEGLKSFTRLHDSSVIAAEKGTSEPCIGEWCSYCPAEATCPAKKAEVAKVDLIPCNTELPAELSEALAIAERVESWIKAVRDTAHNLLEKGVDIEGYKLVNKRATRKWTDTEAIEKKVKLAKKIKIADAFDMKIKSPAQLEKVCQSLGVDWDKFSKDLVASVSTGTTLVSEHDKRQAVITSSASKLLAERFAQ